MVHTNWTLHYGAYNCIQSSPAILVDRVIETVSYLFRGTGIPHDKGVVAGVIDSPHKRAPDNIVQSDVDPD